MLPSSSSTTNSNTTGDSSSSLTSLVTFPPDSKKGLVGLQSKGTCFVNSAIQCLSNTPDFLKLFLTDEYKKDINEQNPLGSGTYSTDINVYFSIGGKLTHCFSSLLRDLWFGNSSSIAPLELKKIVSELSPHMISAGGGDSQEFLSFLLDYLHEDLNRVLKKPYVEVKDYDGRPDEIVAEESWSNHLKRNQSVIQELLHGQLKAQYECSECKKKFITFDPFGMISLPIPQDTEKETLNLYDCIKLLTKTEKIELEIGWYCSGCKTHREAVKKTDIYKLPPILVLHLKRAQPITWLQAKKLTDLVEFPLEGLDLREYVLNNDKNAIYDLYAVSNHHGKTVQGQYTTFAKNLIDKKWYHFVDSEVLEVNEKEIVSSDAYVLFYKKREVN